jgi:hypothetical protein
MAKRRSRLSLRRDAALSATRISIGSEKLVYLLIADKKLKYPNGKSRIAYIGTTKKGVARISQSVATRAEDILSLHGVRAFHARVVTCRPRQRVKTWLKLERALLLRFRDLYGSVPKCNSHGKKIKEMDEFSYFARNGVTLVLEELA